MNPHRITNDLTNGETRPILALRDFDWSMSASSLHIPSPKLYTEARFPQLHTLINSGVSGVWPSAHHIQLNLPNPLNGKDVVAVICKPYPRIPLYPFTHAIPTYHFIGIWHFAPRAAGTSMHHTYVCPPTIYTESDKSNLWHLTLTLIAPLVWRA